MCVSSLTSLWQTGDMQSDASEQANQLREDARFERDAAAKRAVRIRRAGEAQQSQTISDLAASGVSVSSGTALKAAAEPANRAEEDAAEELLYGSRRAERLEEGAQRTRRNARRKAIYTQINVVGGSVLSGGSGYGSGWSGGSSGSIDT